MIHSAKSALASIAKTMRELLMVIKVPGIGGIGAIAPLALLFVGHNFDMQNINDQVFVRNFSGANYYITTVVARQRTGGGSATNQGGIYTGANKTGTQLVPSTQQWVSLTSGVIVVATLGAAVQTNLQSATPILSLTSASAAPLTADIFIYGVDVS